MKIRIIGISKEYNGKEVLHVDKLNFNEGHVYALMGSNGSGKTTLLQCVAGLEQFTKGKILYDDYNSFEFVKKDISVMLQKPYLFNDSVSKNIIIGLKFRKLSEKVIKERMKRYSQYLNVDNLLNKNAKELSGGEQAKISLIRTAILETKMTFLDEPTASMDIESTLKAERLIKFMAQGEKSVILVTHDLMQAKRVADYIIFLDKGRIIEQGEKKEVLNNPKHNLLNKMIRVRDKN